MNIQMNSITRRTVLKNAPLAAGSMALLASAPQMLRAESLATAPGIQLYTFWKELAEDVPGTLAKLSAIGYKSVESAGLVGKTATEFRKALDDAGLKCPSSHLFLPPNVTAHQYFESIRILGSDYAVPSVLLNPASPIKSAEDYMRLIAALTQDDFKKMAAELNTMAAQARSFGLQFAYHNHNIEFRKWSDGATAYDILMSETDPSLVKIELDCGWADLAGHPAPELFKKFPGRFRMLHIKDFVPVAHPSFTLGAKSNPEWTKLGKGHIDYRAILAAAPAVGVEQIFVEQEPPYTKFTALEAAKAGYDYLRSIG
jgi:sugar phosphate isomerase/epimerase